METFELLAIRALKTRGLDRSHPLLPNSIAGIMRACMPTDRLFSIDELIGLMRRANRGKVIKEMSARNQFHKYTKQGLVRRVMRAEDRSYLWAVQGFDPPVEVPLTSKYLWQAMADLIDELGPMTVAELIVTLQSRGYRATADPRKLNRIFMECLNGKKGVFRKGEKGRWGLVG